MTKGILHSLRIVSFLTVLSISLSVKPQVVIVSGSQDPTLGKEFYQLNFKVLDNFTGIRIPYVNAYLMTTDSVVVDSVQVQQATKEKMRMKRIPFRLQGIKKGDNALSPTFVNLKSNTMKNTMQN